MSTSSDSFCGMDDTGEMNDRDIERLLGGRMPADGEAPGLARFLGDFDATYPEPSLDHCEAAHLSAIFAAAQQPAESERPLPGQASATPKPAPRNWTARRFPKWAGVKLAIPLAIMLFAFGGVALAGGFVYHEVSDPGRSTEVTQPGPGDTVLDATDVDDADGAAIVEGEQKHLDDPDDAAIEKGDGDDLGEADEADEGHEADEADEADEGDDPAIEENDRSDQSDADGLAIEEEDPGDQPRSEDRGGEDSHPETDTVTKE